MINALFAFLHFAAAFAIVFCLAVEMVTLKQTMTAGEMRRLQRVDSVYGLAAATVLVAHQPASLAATASVSITFFNAMRVPF